MSSALSKDAAAQIVNAADVEQQASLWLERRDFGDWNGEAQAELDAWLGSSWENRVAYWRLDAAWNRAERLAALHRPTNDAPARFMPPVIGIAAGLALIAMLGVAAAHFMTPPAEKTYSTAIGGRELVTFADGTHIELNTDTVLRTRMTTAERTVWLDRGEAYFEVRHDAAHPFVVMTGRNRVTDLGTKFVVRRDTGLLEIALLQGGVRFGAADGQSQSLLMAPGDAVIATADSISVSKKSTQQLFNELSWRHGMLHFDGTPLADVAAEFNRYSAKKIIIADPAIASIEIDGTFRSDNVDAFIGTVQRVFGLHIKHNGENIAISR